MASRMGVASRVRVIVFGIIAVIFIVVVLQVAPTFIVTDGGAMFSGGHPLVDATSLPLPLPFLLLLPLSLIIPPLQLIRLLGARPGRGGSSWIMCIAIHARYNLGWAGILRMQHLA
jgi:hypothetical protein